MLRDDIAAVIDAAHDAYSPYHNDESYPDFIAAKVLAHLGLTEEWGVVLHPLLTNGETHPLLIESATFTDREAADGFAARRGWPGHVHSRRVGPWRVVEEKENP